MNIRALRWSVRYRLGSYPLYLPFARWKYDGSVVGPDTELVIEGFPRSGNTFALFAFHLSQRRPVRVAHHLHAPAQLTTAARRRIPALLLIREPEAAVLSVTIREPFVSPAEALRAYSVFYRRLLPVRERLVVAEFGRTTRDLGSVIAEINRRFSTDFGTFENTPENVERVFQLIEDRNRRPPWSRAVAGFENGEIGPTEYEMAVEEAGGRGLLAPASETRVPRPSVERENMKERIRERVRAQAALLADARHIYRHLLPNEV